MTFDYLKLETDSQPGAFSQYDIEILVKELEKLPEFATYVEIGVDRGKSLSVAKMVDKQLNRGFLLYGVDINKPKELEEWLETKPGVHFLYGDSVGIANRWVVQIGELLDSVDGQPIDLLFIDGDHSYEGCKRDIEAWYPLMAMHGVMLFHDYDESSPGVIQAVDEFAKEYDLRVEVCKTERLRTSIVKIQL